MQSKPSGVRKTRLGPGYRPILSVVGIVLFFAITATCTTDEDRIQDAQEAVDSGVITERDRESGKINIFDIRGGDCFNETDIGDTVGGTTFVLEVELVPCSGNWEFHVLDIFTSNQSGEFPSDAAFDVEAIRRCSVDYDFYYLPSRDSWGSGDRLITCMEEG